MVEVKFDLWCSFLWKILFYSDVLDCWCKRNDFLLQV